jgi:hypothetical protein
MSNENSARLQELHAEMQPHNLYLLWELLSVLVFGYSDRAAQEKPGLFHEARHGEAER